MYLCIHFLSSRQRLIGCQSGIPWIQGREAAEMPGAEAHLHQNTLPQAESYFFYTCDTTRLQWLGKSQSGILVYRAKFHFDFSITTTTATLAYKYCKNIPAIAIHLWQKNKIRNFGYVQNSRFSFFLPLFPSSLYCVKATSASSVTVVSEPADNSSYLFLYISS